MVFGVSNRSANSIYWLSKPYHFPLRLLVMIFSVYKGLGMIIAYF